VSPTPHAERRPSAVIDVVSPIDGKPIGQVPAYSAEEALCALGRARRAQAVWGAASHEQRERKLRRYLGLVHRSRAELAGILTAESGKTLFESYLFEVASILHLGDYFLANAPRILKRRRISISVFKNRTSYIHYRPRGVVLVISPWNFPLSNSMGEVLMALIAGNAVLLKPASLTPLVAVRMAPPGWRVSARAPNPATATAPARRATQRRRCSSSGAISPHRLSEARVRRRS
jgi:acyl-CoA reductase-like NAD-dependent aldehyde dehydrogenase